MENQNKTRRDNRRTNIILTLIMVGVSLLLYYLVKILLVF